MAIMVAGGMTLAAPGMAPAAHADHNANLFVSAENEASGNGIAGPQVIEVVVNDPNIADTDEGTGEPDVTVNGADLRMVQATDGSWYGYFAAQDQATTANGSDTGIKFGTLASFFSDADGDYWPNTSGTEGDTKVYSLARNGEWQVAYSDDFNVVREAKQPNDANNDNLPKGDLWPFVQLYEFNPTGNITVQYNKGGGAQSATFLFDTIASDISLDRQVYPAGAQLHATITDAWLNIDPTDEDSWTFDTANEKTFYQVFDENGVATGNSGEVTDYIGDLMCDENCLMLITTDATGQGDVIAFQGNGNGDLRMGDATVTLTESGPNSAMFATYDDSDVSSIVITDDANRNTSGIFDYNDSDVSVLVGFEFATIDIDPLDDEWNSGEAIPIVIVDGDGNKNSRADEDFVVSDPSVSLIPAFETGDPFTLGEGDLQVVLANTNLDNTNQDYHVDLSATGVITTEVEVQPFSDRAMITASSGTGVDTIIIDFGTTEADFEETVLAPINDLGDVSAILASYHDEDLEPGEKDTLRANAEAGVGNFNGFNLYNHDVQSFGPGPYDVWFLHVHNDDGATTIINDDGTLNSEVYADLIAEGIGAQDLVQIDNSLAYVLTNISEYKPTDDVGLAIVGSNIESGGTFPIVADFFSYGFINDGELGGERVANQIIRVEVEESGDNTGTFEGELEYIMINQLNILDADTYTGLSTIADDPTFIVIEDFTDEDSIRVNYLDLGADGVSTQIADQQEAPSHSGIVSLDSDSYKVADTVTITLEDADLNVDSGLIDIFTIDGSLPDTVGTELAVELNTGNLGRVLDVTFDDSTWTTGTCNVADFGGADTGLASTGFTLIETGVDSGVFMGDFQIPDVWCNPNADGGPKVESTTGLDIEVNYVDFRDASGEIIEVGDGAGVRANTGSVSLDRTVYPVPIGPDVFEMKNGEYLPQTDLNVHIRVNDVDYDISAAGEDTINDSVAPVKVSVMRGSDEVVLGYAGGANPDDAPEGATNFGAIEEIAPDAGIFEADITISYDMGPEHNRCPTDNNMCILQGDILQVEYTDPTDASGEPNSVTDSATFDLRNGVLQSDKSVYIIGSDIILTLIEPDFDLDNDQAETYPLNLIEWDSDAATVAMGEDAAFDPEPSDLRETGDSTGIFQIVIETPAELDDDRLERGEEIELEYTDFGPSGSDYVGDEDEDIGLTIYTSNFGATVELDQKVYTWTDKVYITIVAPDHNFDSDLVDEIGESDLDPIKVSTRSADIDNYKLVETGTDTGIFTGEVILTGFEYDADGDTTTGDNGNDVQDLDPSGSGPTDGKLPTSDDDGLSVSFEFSEDETIVGSAIIRWNIGEAQWLEASYPATGTGIVRVIDPDMNLNPEAVDNFEVDVWSESDAGGIDLTVTETNEATGIFEGTVFFDVTGESTGHRLRVAEGDTITAEYDDNTLPAPDSAGDSLSVTATTLIGTIVPPLERAPASNLRVVDAFNNSLDTVSVDQQVQITADLTNGQDKDQAFAYLVQVQDGDGVTVALDWISGTLSPAQSFTTANSWIPTEAGSYTATAFVWESVDNPTALSPPLTTTITVN